MSPIRERFIKLLKEGIDLKCHLDDVKSTSTPRSATMI